MIDDRTFVSDSKYHVHLWVRNPGNKPTETKWTFAITQNANDPFGQRLTNSKEVVGSVDSQKAAEIKLWLEQNRCGGMYGNLAGKLLRIQTDLKAGK